MNNYFFNISFTTKRHSLQRPKISLSDQNSINFPAVNNCSFEKVSKGEIINRFWRKSFESFLRHTSCFVYRSPYPTFGFQMSTKSWNTLYIYMILCINLGSPISIFFRFKDVMVRRFHTYIRTGQFPETTFSV